MSGTMKFDVQSALELRWGNTDKAIIKHGATFLAFEAQRPVAEQLKDLSPTFFTRLVDAAREAAAEAGLGEAERARAAERVRQIDAQLPALVDKILMQLKLHYAGNLADLELHGLKTTTGPRGGSRTRSRRRGRRSPAASPSSATCSSPPTRTRSSSMTTPSTG